MIYWDTSSVLKLYVAESDSERWEALALRTDEDFASSALLETELAFALTRKESESSIRQGAARALLGLFRQDVEHGRFTLYPVGTDVLEVAASLAARCAEAGQSGTLRTLDGIHLASAVTLRCQAIATADRRMRAAADLPGLPLI